MSAPIAFGAMASSTSLLFTPSISNPLLAVVPVGMWAKASISPLSELAREAGEAQPGRQGRSSTYPQVVLVDLPRRAVAEALMLPFLVVEARPRTDSGLSQTLA